MEFTKVSDVEDLVLQAVGPLASHVDDRVLQASEQVYKKVLDNVRGMFDSFKKNIEENTKAIEELKLALFKPRKTTKSVLDAEGKTKYKVVEEIS